MVIKELHNSLKTRRLRWESLHLREAVKLAGVQEQGTLRREDNGANLWQAYRTTLKLKTQVE